MTTWRDVLDGALELPVAPSFTRVGIAARRRAEGWTDPDSALAGRTVVLTGATSGLGFAAARRIAAAGARLVVVGRDRRRTEAARDRIVAAADEAGPGTGRAEVRVALADMGDLDAVRALAATLAEDLPEVHALVHNAGALSHERTESPQGIEATVASQVVGPFLLTSMLLPRLRAARPGRVVTMSSGGMYAAPLTVSGLQMPAGSYDGTRQYALAKRAQVTLNEMWAERVPDDEVVFHALHPGWADTPGVRESLPTFRRVVGPLLRTPDEGADTLVWLCAADEPTHTSGGFWHDRRRRPLHRLPTTSRTDTPQRRTALWESVESMSGTVPDRA